MKYGNCPHLSGVAIRRLCFSANFMHLEPLARHALAFATYEAATSLSMFEGRN